METIGEPDSTGRIKELVDEIIRAEWDMFSTVPNAGGPAACQSQDQTFEIMRRAQFSTWSEESLISYRRDLAMATAQGRNLMTEKYARMMSVTHPEEYAQIESMLPAIPERVFVLVEAISAQHRMWDERVAEELPKVRGRGRTRDEEAQVGAVPTANTYLIGELLTYSEATLDCLMRDVEAAVSNGRNLVREQLEATVRAYGWESLDAAEAAQ